MNEILLAGCTPAPLADYLKALGVLRLLSAKYPKTRGFWRGDRFVLCTELDRDAIKEFFLNDYEPTPIIAPWGARSGFYEGASEKTAREALFRIELSDKKQLQYFREMIGSMRALLSRHGITEKATDEKKLELLRICRSELPDHLLEWLDTCYVLIGDDRRFPPLLGTGGNEGSGSYVSGFAQQVVASVADRLHDTALSASLFSNALPEAAVDQTPGHFAPSDTGGVNASIGFEDSKARTNPWDYILALEGTLVLAGAVARRSADDPKGTLSYPFTVHAVCAGAGSLGEGDESKPRGELWLPIWRQSSSYAEVRALMAEGRVAFGKKPVRDALDFIRAVHHLGGYRGIHSFQRFGMLKRNGKAYFATSLSRVEVSDEPQSRWLDDLDRNHWLDRFRQFTRGNNTANRFRILRKRLEDALFGLSGKAPSKAEAQALLKLLGEIQFALSSSREARELVPPLPRLSEQWVQAADDGTPAFRIAKALAGLQGVNEQPLPLRAQLFPVHRKYAQWMTPDAGENVRIHTGLKGRLTDTLSTLLQRRLWLMEKLDMQQEKPLDSVAGATLEDVVEFLRGDHLDKRIAKLLPGLCLCSIPKDVDHSVGQGVLPAAFGLMKLSITPNRILQPLGCLPESNQLPIPVGMLAQLAANNPENRATRIAWRRLRSSGLAPAFSSDALPELAGIDPLRAAAALLIPLRYGATGALTRQVLKVPETETDVA